MIRRFYRFPDLDARIGVYDDGTRTHVAFLAKGNSYKGTGAARKLYKRNPDRTAAVDRFLSQGLLIVDSVRIGKTANGPSHPGDFAKGADGRPVKWPSWSPETARKAYSKGGNYRFDLLVMAPILPEFLGLVPCENRPVPLAFGGAS